MISVDIKMEVSDYAGPLDGKIIRKEFKEIVIAEGKRVQESYRFLQSFFKPSHRVHIRRKSGSGRSPADGQPGSIYSAVGSDKIYGSVLIWLEDGTDVRYRNMSADWRSMTKPGGGMSFGTSRGRPMGFGYNRGIAARNFRDDMISRMYPRFVAIADRKFTAMLKRARWI